MIVAITTIITFFAMEAVAWSMHKYIMHGIGWRFHKDHHQKDDHNSFFEKNDVFFILFSILAMTAYISWSLSNVSFLLGIGIGISIYGAVYFFIHDLFIHQRIKVLRNTQNRYLLALRRAHKIHHKYLEKEDGECFGLLFVPYRFYKAAFKD